MQERRSRQSLNNYWKMITSMLKIILVSKERRGVYFTRKEHGTGNTLSYDGNCPERGLSL
jgi:hypothetical protein